MIISIIPQSSTSSHDENSQQPEIEVNFHNLIKSTYKIPIINILLNDERLNIFLSKVRNKARMSCLTTPIQSHSGSPNQCNKEQEIKDKQIGNK